MELWFGHDRPPLFGEKSASALFRCLLLKVPYQHFSCALVCRKEVFAPANPNGEALYTVADAQCGVREGTG